MVFEVPPKSPVDGAAPNRLLELPPNEEVPGAAAGALVKRELVAGKAFPGVAVDGVNPPNGDWVGGCVAPKGPDPNPLEVD